jgi:flagellar basal-body rod protein FlgB
MDAISNSLQLHATELRGREQRNTVLAPNIAKAAMPHFSACGIDFAAEMGKATNTGEMRSSHAANTATVVAGCALWQGNGFSQFGNHPLHIHHIVMYS